MEQWPVPDCGALSLVCLDNTIDALRQDNAVAETEIAKSHRGQPLKKRVTRAAIQLQERLHCRKSAEIVRQTCNLLRSHWVLLRTRFAFKVSVVSETGYVNEK